MLCADVGEVARITLKEGRAEIEKISINLFSPIKPMLAGTAYDLKEVLTSKGRVALEYKFDGVRIQIYIKGVKVRIFQSPTFRSDSELTRHSILNKRKDKCQRSCVGGRSSSVWR